MMKIQFIFALIFFVSNSYATEQKPDLLLVGKDTIYLITFPLEDLKLQYRPFGLTYESAPNTSCWRGYYAIWRLQNDSLFLEKILHCETDKEENITALFKKNNYDIKVSENKIFADWYDKTLLRFCPDYKYYQDNIFLDDKNYNKKAEKIIIFRFEKGILKLNNLKK